MSEFPQTLDDILAALAADPGEKRQVILPMTYRGPLPIGWRRLRSGKVTIYLTRQQLAAIVALNRLFQERIQNVIRPE